VLTVSENKFDGLRHLRRSGLRSILRLSPLWIRLLMLGLSSAFLGFVGRWGNGFLILLGVLGFFAFLAWAVLGVIAKETMPINAGKKRSRTAKAIVFVLVFVPLALGGFGTGNAVALAISPYSAEELEQRAEAAAERALATQQRAQERAAERERNEAEKSAAAAAKEREREARAAEDAAAKEQRDRERAEAAAARAEAQAEEERAREAAAERQRQADAREAERLATEGALRVIQSDIELGTWQTMEEWSAVFDGLPLPSRDRFDAIVAKDLAD